MPTIRLETVSPFMAVNAGVCMDLTAVRAVTAHSSSARDGHAQLECADVARARSARA